MSITPLCYRFNFFSSDIHSFFQVCSCKGQCICSMYCKKKNVLQYTSHPKRQIPMMWAKACILRISTWCSRLMLLWLSWSTKPAWWGLQNDWWSLVSSGTWTPLSWMKVMFMTTSLGTILPWKELCVEMRYDKISYHVNSGWECIRYTNTVYQLTGIITHRHTHGSTHAHTRSSHAKQHGAVLIASPGVSQTVQLDEGFTLQSSPPLPSPLLPTYTYTYFLNHA